MLPDRAGEENAVQDAVGLALPVPGADEGSPDLPSVSRITPAISEISSSKSNTG